MCVTHVFSESFGMLHIAWPFISKYFSGDFLRTEIFAYIQLLLHKFILLKYYHRICYAYCDFISCPIKVLYNIFSCGMRSRLGLYILFSCHICLISFHLEYFHCLSLSFIRLTFLKNITNHNTHPAMDCYSIWICLMFQT